MQTIPQEVTQLSLDPIGGGCHRTSFCSARRPTRSGDKEEEGEEEKQKLAGTPGALEQASKPAKLCEWRGSFKIRFSRKKKHPISLPDLLGWLYPLKIWESKMTFHQSSEPPYIFFQIIFSSTNLSESFVESSNSNWLKFPNPFFLRQAGGRY